MAFVLLASFEYRERVADLWIPWASTEIANPGAIFHNPAGTCNIKKISAYLGYTSPYTYFSLHDISGSVTFPVKPKGTAGIGVGAYLLETEEVYYRETEFVGSFSYPIKRFFLIGINLKYLLLGIKEMGTAGTFNMDTGLILEPIQGISLGAYAHNFLPLTLGKSAEQPSWYYSLGIRYVPVKEISVCLGVNKLPTVNTGLYGGLLVKIKRFQLKFGFTTVPSTLGAGMSFRLGPVAVSYLYTYRELGGSHLLGLAIAPTIERKPIRAPEPERRMVVMKKIDINTATVRELVSLPNMTYALAFKIISYREEKGKFKTIEDLLKVPGMSTQIFEKIKDHITVGELAKININTADLSQLIEAGFTPLQAQKILQHREAEGPFSSVDDLYKVPGIPPEVIDSIKDRLEAR